MEKLELKHLAPYLPYGVMFQKLYRPHNDQSNVHKYIGELKGLEVGRFGELYFISDDGYDKNINSSFKPILRPLSDLQRLIETEFYKWHEGEKADEEIINLFCDENVNFDDITEVDINKLPYECILYTAKHHYDFQDLINKGLAIDINKARDGLSNE